MKIFAWQSLTADQQAAALRRPEMGRSQALMGDVRRTLEQVRQDGDSALRALTRRFDGIELADIRVSEAEFLAAEATVSPTLRKALAEARERLLLWHRAGIAGEFEIETAPGVSCGRLLRGIGRVGLYVPAGSAPLPSTALMLGVPAQLAGCATVVLCTPPRADGCADPAILVAARLCGIDQVYKLGGAQAIAAMAFGTESVPRCDKLFGPGNVYVTAAKQQVAAAPGGAAIDLPAGPSEVLVIADTSARAEFLAADLLAQAEHGPDSQVLMISDSRDLLASVDAKVERQLARLPRREIAGRALEHARLIEAPIEIAFEISNRYAPEHLILQLRDGRAWLPKVRAAGSVFLGDYAPETLGDYCSGTNHVLPTGGAARAYSGVSVASFQTSISVQSVSREGLTAIGPCAIEISRAEGLEAHARAVLVRLEERA